MKRKIIPLAIVCFSLTILFPGCNENPLTGKKTMAFVSNSLLFPSSFQQYSEFISEHTVVTGTAEAEMVARVGDNIRQATEKWFAAEDIGEYLEGYRWEYNLVESGEINAWCMPGGKIVVYTGILEITQNEDSLAAVLGHEVAHALLNHGQQRTSAGILQRLGAFGLRLLLGDSSELAQQVGMAAYDIGSQLLGTLPFSRAHESEADYYGLILMAIAGYNPAEAIEFWERMETLEGGGPEFLSTHPANSTRIASLRELIPQANAIAAEINER